jgi:uncharacterized protein involved in exopolysaccharide biosynthesis
MVLRFLSDGIELRQSRNTGLTEVSFHSNSAEEAAEVANKVAAVFCAMLPGNRGSIVEMAKPPVRPVRPNLPLNVVIGAVAGMASGIFAGALFGLIAFGQLRRRVASAGAEETIPLLPAGSRWIMAAITVLFVLGVSLVARAIFRTPKHMSR